MNSNESINYGTAILYRRVNADLSNPSEIRYMTSFDSIGVDIIQAATKPDQFNEYAEDLIIDVDETLAKYRGELATIEVEGMVIFRTFEESSDRMLVTPIWAKGVTTDHLAHLSQELGTVRFMWSDLYQQMGRFSKDSGKVWYDAKHVVADKPVCVNDGVVYSVVTQAFTDKEYAGVILRDEY